MESGSMGASDGGNMKGHLDNHQNIRPGENLHNLCPWPTRLFEFLGPGYNADSGTFRVLGPQRVRFGITTLDKFQKMPILGEKRHCPTFLENK
jgi:hypothetical protein